MAAQELVQSLREQSSAAEGRLSAATSHVEDCLAALAASEAANKVAQEAMKVVLPPSPRSAASRLAAASHIACLLICGKA